jgi:hypothetical protein
MLHTILILAGIPCSIAQLPTPDRALLNCSGREISIEVEGVRALPPRAAGHQALEPSLRELSQRLSGSAITVAATAGRTRLVTAGGHDLAVEIVRSGFGWASLDHPDLRAAEREARTRRRGIWSLDVWHAQRSARSLPVDIPTPGPTEVPLRLGPAARSPRPSNPTAWAQRLEDFQREIDALASDPSPDAEPEL